MRALERIWLPRGGVDTDSSLVVSGPRQNARADSSGLLGLVVSLLFALPFCAGGIWGSYRAVRELLAPVPDERALLVALVFAVLFGGGGGGMAYAFLGGYAELQRLNRRKAQWPGQPWMWRPDWAAGRVEAATKGTMIGSWIFGGFWNLITWTSIALIPWSEVLRQREAVAFVMLAFMLVGVLLLVRAVRATLQWRKFGMSIFAMASVPAPIGSELRGRIATHFRARPSEGLRATLSCINRVTTGTGDTRNTIEKVLWQEEQTMPPAAWELCVDGWAVPVAFRIPADCKETNDENRNSTFLWRLEGDVSVPGVDYHAVFEVPVFLTEKSVANAGNAEPADTPHVPVGYQPPRDSRITVGPSPGGGIEFVFPAWRNVGAGISMSMFTLLWTGAIWLMVSLGAPVFFPVCFGAFDMLLVMILLHAWLATTRVVVGSGVVRISRRAFGLSITRVVPCDEVERVRLKIGMQSGTTPYYDLTIVRRDGREVNAGSSIRDKRHAEWLALQMQERIG